LTVRHRRSVFAPLTKTARGASLCLATLIALAAGAQTCVHAGHLRATMTGFTEAEPNRTPVVPIAVFGKDERRKLEPGRSALRERIGLLFTDDAKTACTAFCVGDRTIATASHCLFRPTGERRANLSGFRFALKEHAGVPVSRLAGYKTHTVAKNVLAGGLALRIAPPIDASRDWALVRLDKPICKARAIPLAAKTPRQIAALARGGRLFQVSYHRDFANLALAHSGNCAPDRKLTAKRRAAIEHDFSAPEHLVLHHCDTGGASSGSPLLVETADGSIAAVAINVGTYVQTPLMMRDGKVVYRFKADALANTAVTAASFETALKAFTRANILPTTAEMRRLQSGLAGLGLYRGRIDGAYGPQTRNAIIDFELARGVMPTGLATLETLAAVSSDEAPSLAGRGGLASPSASNVEIRSSRPSVDRLDASPFGPRGGQ
jgi:hypothetical protein